MKDLNGSPQAMVPRFITIKEAAKRAMIDPQTLLMLTRQAGLPVIRLNSRLIRIPVVEFDAWWLEKTEGSISSGLTVSEYAIQEWARELSRG